MKNAIVLASGLGRKVWPYGEFRQKCTIPVANKPIIRHIVENLVEIGCSRIIVVVGHYAQQVRGTISDISNVEFVTQNSLEGTADAALTALKKLNGENFLIIYGDTVTTSEKLS